MTGAPSSLALSPALQLAEAWQRGFPLCAEPYRHLGAAHDLTGPEVIAMFAELAETGVLARIGAAVRPNVIGASTLAALSAPPGRLGEVAALVSREPGVNHNYEREHALNLWFVATGPDRAALAATLDRIGRASGCDILDLPLERAYHIDLGFRLAGPRGMRQDAARRQCSGEADALDRALLTGLEGGLALEPRPYARLAQEACCEEAEAIERLRRLVAAGVVSRLGCILRHRRLGYIANAMAVWDVPDEEVDGAGALLAGCDAVTLCYRRRRAPPAWPYNLFAMIHGRERAAVEREIERAARIAGLASRPAAILFSRRCFKQEAARYGRSAEAA